MVAHLGQGSETMGPMIIDGFVHQLPDTDPDETQEWRDSLDAVVDIQGKARARYLLSTLLERYQGGDNRRALALLRKISPVAWQHIHLLGHYTFRGNGHAIDLEALLANVKLG